MKQRRLVNEKADTQKVQEEISRAIREFKPKMKGVLGLSLKDIMEMDVKKLHEVVKEKYLDYSESRGTYASSASGKTFDKSMWARSWAYEMDGNGFRAKAIDCSKREMRRVWDANPYDGWCPQYYSTKVVKTTVLQFKHGFKMAALFDEENSMKWVGPSEMKPREEDAKSFSRVQPQYEHGKDFFTHQAASALEDYLVGSEEIALSDLNQLLHDIMSQPTIRAQMERHYKKQRAGTLDAHKKGYDEENYKRQLQRQKPMMLVKARDRKISQAFSKPVTGQWLKSTERPFEIGDMVAWAVGAKGLEDAVWVDSSDIGFQADEQRLAEDLADAVAEAMEEWIEGLGDGDEVTADDFKRQCEDAISLAQGRVDYDDYAEDSSSWEW